MSNPKDTKAPKPLTVMKVSNGTGALVSTRIGAKIPANLLIMFPRE